MKRSDRPEYVSWYRAKHRCTNQESDKWPRYGGRGITMCQRWRESFENFLADMGPRPPGTSIDRIDNNGNYEPGNCRWATPTEQSRNTRWVKLRAHEPELIRGLASAGVKHAEIARMFGVCRGTVTKIIAHEVWKTFDGRDAREQLTAAERARNRASTKLTMAIADEIRRRYASGDNAQGISDALGVNKSTLKSVYQGKTWRL